MWSVLLAAFVLCPAQNEGEGEGEGEACAITCVDDVTLTYCDDDELVTLPCAEVHPEARCALLADVWGDDCLLPAGAACDDAYAFGRSRCAGGLACLDGVCAPGAPSPDEPAEPTAGTVVDTTTTATATSPFSCASCPTTSLLLLGPGWLVRRRRR